MSGINPATGCGIKGPDCEHRNWGPLIGVFAFLYVIFSPTNAVATGTYCAVAEKTADGFVSLRVGPGVSYPLLATVVPRDLLWIDTGRCREFMGREFCDPTGKWVFVEKVFSIGGTNSAQGWINSKLVRQVACEEETVEAGQQIYFPCRNMNDGRFLVDGPDWAKKMSSLGYKKDMGYKLLKFTENVPERPNEWTNGVCLFEIVESE